MSRRETAIRKLSHLLYRGVVDHGDATELLSAYAAALDMRGIVIGYDFGGGSAQAEIPPDWPDIYERHRFEDPSAAFLAGAAPGASFIASRDFPGRSRTGLDEVFLRADFRDVMIQSFHTVSRESIYLVGYRARRMRSFSSEDSTLAYLLHPHVAGALATHTALLAISDSARCGTEAADGHAYISFPPLSVTLSARARALWQKILGPMSAHGWQKVERVVARAALDFQRGVVGARSRLLLPSVRVEFAWVPPKPDERHRAAALFFAEQTTEPALMAPIAELLSPTQRAVAARAARGATNGEIAAALSISVETTRSHLRAIFLRLGVERRTELAAFLAGRVDDQLDP